MVSLHGGKKRSRPLLRNRDANLDSSIDFANLDFTPCPAYLAYEELSSKDADDLSGIACGWLADMELIRTKSKNLNGRLFGYWKDRIASEDYYQISCRQIEEYG